ncbi:MAG: acyl-CoA thioesterase [Ignavibacteriae bacterium]|nr:acyl-CoA thioesterase [Ignavibacteriota bacterium]
MIKQTTQIRVRYADTDQMKFVYYGKYFEYFEQGRSDLLRTIGLPYPEVERMGIFLPVIEASAKYRKPARYDDLLLVETIMMELPVARVRIEYKVWREAEEEPIVQGYTVHSFMNAETGKPTRAPQVFLHAIEENMKANKEDNA